MTAAFGNRRYLPYVLSGGITTLALGVTLATRALGDHEQLLLFFAAVAVSTAVWGWRAGLLAAALSAAFYSLFIAPPFGSFAIDDPADVRRLVVFLVVALALLVLFASREQAIAELQSSEEMLSLSLAAGRMKAWAANFQSGDFWGTAGTSGDGRRSNNSWATTYEAFVASVHPEDRRKFMRAVDVAVGAERDCELDHRILIRNGDYRWVNTRLRVHFDGSGFAAYLFGVSIDVDKPRSDEHEESPSPLSQTQRH
jgi:hypothetical protein